MDKKAEMDSKIFAISIFIRSQEFIELSWFFAYCAGDISIIMGSVRSLLPPFWQKPKLITKDSEHQQETWLDLFYDLIFVGVISELAKWLQTDISLKNFLGFVFLYLPVWWVWIGSTVYNNRFESDDASYRIVIFLKMLAVAGLGITIHGALGEYSVAFACFYIFARLILILLWYRAGKYNPVAKPLTDRYNLGFLISIILWTISLFVPLEYRFYFWGAGLLVDLGTPHTTFAIQKKLPQFNTAHLNKRFGLFTIIVLGEAVIGILHGLALHPNFDLYRILIAVFAFLLTFSIWWIYFDDVMQENRLPTFPWITLWSYGHFFLAVGLTAFGAGISALISSEDINLAWRNIDWLLTGAIAISLLSLALIELSYVIRQKQCELERECGLLRLFGGGLALFVGIFAFSFGPLPVLLVLVVLQIFQIIRGRSVQRRLQLQ